ncbi:ABC transporter permease [Paenibacillus beijingensis]|uniref:Glycine/betaine ABC transporter n=1 Tax=Paenibacillus beijingensis TaxID=1126833 RepID=A0A0D5NGN4_9BACL|nr:proline/glycine betaine ABC transporter permease [Paenibacillus beijingensis]AJY74431.1 glycine/betaine ABC transporter [Paenibacillus beijingensis]
MMTYASREPLIPLEKWADISINYIIHSFSGVFDGLNNIITAFIRLLQWVLLTPPEWLVAVVLVALCWRLAGIRTAIYTALGLLLLFALGLWEASMITLSLVLASTILSLVCGVPLGVLAYRFERFGAIIKPTLDIMQTMPAFVYLIPVVLLFGLGDVTALIATFVFAMPPSVRLTLLGIQQVPKETIEAATAYGATEWQKLFKVQLPLAKPMIMAGINQVIMLSLSMVVISSMVGAGGLGAEVLRSISTLDVGRGFVGGISVVIIAVLLDRISQRFGQKTNIHTGH